MELTEREIAVGNGLRRAITDDAVKALEVMVKKLRDEMEQHWKAQEARHDAQLKSLVDIIKALPQPEVRPIFNVDMPKKVKTTKSVIYEGNRPAKIIEETENE